MLINPDQAYVERRRKREEDERLRAEYFAKGGVIHRYDPGVQGVSPYAQLQEWRRRRLQQNLARQGNKGKKR